MRPDLKTFDVILVNSSAGKDSQAMLDHVVSLATADGVKDRVVVVHCDLGRVEWAGTRDLAELQAKAYGVRFEVVSRELGDLLDQVEARGMWPDNRTRYCTSDQKRAQVLKLMTALVKERWAGAPVRILNCLGIRAQESTARSKLCELELNERATNGRREVWTWHPIFEWGLDRVWSTIRASGVPHHPAYDLGMPRLSCVFCIFSGRNALLLAGKHNRALLDEYVRVETKIGHSFKRDLTLASVRDALERGEEPGPINTWEAGPT